MKGCGDRWCYQLPLIEVQVIMICLIVVGLIDQGEKFWITLYL